MSDPSTDPTAADSPPRSAAAIRADFIEFFRERHGHAFVPSSPVVPHADPTLLFTNAGMNQFKDVFLGAGHRPYSRAVNSQKCIRAGGKHNDLEDVGRDGYHHTFFEMLGNWSFGDYFKADAIDWAWELLVDRWRLDPGRLYATVFAGDVADGTPADEEAERLWQRFLPSHHVSRHGRKDNFWEMGDSGPCGPCSELHYDGRTEVERVARPGHELVNRGHPDVIEIWNLVFIEFNRDGGTLTRLPARHVDTGMGLERLVRCLQDRQSNYDTDLWTPLFDAIRRHGGARPYGARLDDPVDIAYRVIADHVRCLSVAIADGALPGSDGRGYVLRRILRRAVRHAHQTLQATGPWLHDLVPAVVETLGPAFPDLERSRARVSRVIREEEDAFLRTLDRGIELFEQAAHRATAGRIAADDAFRLHDTFGFPVDLTRLMAGERGLSVDETGYERLMADAREKSRQGATDSPRTMTLPPDALAWLRDRGIDATVADGVFDSRPIAATVKAVWNGSAFEAFAADTAGERPIAVIVDRTNFYVERGGQVGDHGAIGGADTAQDRFDVHDTQAIGGHVLHIGRLVSGRLSVGDRVTLGVDVDRRAAVCANHTCTHLLNLALRDVLSDETVDQKGSLVAGDRLRFDFSSGRAVAPEELARIQAHVNERIAEGLAVHADVVPLAEAQRINGVRAVFGERYPDPVRVVCVGRSVREVLANPDAVAWRGLSVELCGGTHLSSTAEARHFVVLQEQALAAGVRRITAITGPAAQAAELAGRNLRARVVEAGDLHGDALVAASDELTRPANETAIGAVDRHDVRRQIEALRRRARAVVRASGAEARGDALEQARAISESATGQVVVQSIEGADRETLLAATDVLRARHPEMAFMLFAPDAGAAKVSIVAVVPQGLIAQGLRAGEWVRHAAALCGGGGGGRPDMAMAGGKDAARVPHAIEACRVFATDKLGSA